ncbi:MAG: SURF1 family protein [Ilumatobacteraceae bacterium]
MSRVLWSPKMIALHTFTILLVVVMVNLAFWQLRRHDERVTFNDAVRSRSLEPPRGVDELLALSDGNVGSGTEEGKDLEWYLLSATGNYLPDEDLLLVNLSQDGRAGVDPLGALQLDDGRILIVNRGFIPLSEAVPPPPSGRVSVVGRVRASQERKRGELSDPATGELREVQRIDLDRIAQQLPGAVVPVYIDLLQSEPADAPILSRIAEPTLTLGPHLSYVVQWFVFSACAIVAWGFIVRRALAAVRRATPPA